MAKIKFTPRGGVIRLIKEALTEQPGLTTGELEAKIGRRLAQGFVYKKQGWVRTEPAKTSSGSNSQRWYLTELDPQLPDPTPVNWFGPTHEPPVTEELPKGEFICPTCGKEFVNKIQLAPHIRMAHTEEGKAALARAVERAVVTRKEGAQNRRTKIPELTQAAMEYVWEKQDNDLRNFINWYKEKYSEPTN